MAKNYVEDGCTITFTAEAAVRSGDLVQVGDIFVVAVTDMVTGEAGEGIAKGVFLVPKLASDDMATGKQLYIKDGRVQLEGGPKIHYAGIAWAPAAKGDVVVAMRLNG